MGGGRQGELVGLDNLVLIVDVNGLGMRGRTEFGHDLSAYRRRFEAFGWHAVGIDGHDAKAIDAAYAEAIEADRPAVVLAATDKGHGVAELEGARGWHGKPLPSPMRSGRSPSWVG